MEGVFLAGSSILRHEGDTDDKSKFMTLQFDYTFSDNIKKEYDSSHKFIKAEKDIFYPQVRYINYK